MKRFKVNLNVFVMTALVFCLIACSQPTVSVPDTPAPEEPERPEETQPQIKHVIKKLTTQSSDGSVTIAEYEYNSKGNPVTATSTTVRNGSESSTVSTYEYNEHDDLVKLTTKNQDGTIILSQTSEFDSNYYLIKQTLTMPTSSSVTVYENNSEGKPVKSTLTTVSDGNESVSVTTIEYNEHGDVVKRTTCSNGTNIIQTYEYDSNYYLTKESSIYSEIYSTVIEYENDSDGKHIKTTTTTSLNGNESVTIATYEYNEDGKPLTIRTTMSGYDAVSIGAYEYNEYGDVAKYTISINGTVSSTVLYEYEEIVL